MTSNYVPLGERSIADNDEARRIFQEFLRRQGLKLTRQRELILECFLATDEHLTAEDLYQRVQENSPNIGFSTVYRTLHVMVECGIVREREFSAGKKFYEHIVGEDHHHHHLICTNCGAIVEFVFPQELEQAQDTIAEEHGFVLVGHTHELFGLCRDCRKTAAVPATVAP